MRKSVFLSVHHLRYKITESVAGCPVQKYRLDYQSCIGFPGIGRKADDTPGLQVIALDIALGVKNPDNIPNCGYSGSGDVVAHLYAGIDFQPVVDLFQNGLLHLGFENQGAGFRHGYFIISVIVRIGLIVRDNKGILV